MAEELGDHGVTPGVMMGSSTIFEAPSLASEPDGGDTRDGSGHQGSVRSTRVSNRARRVKGFWSRGSSTHKGQVLGELQGETGEAAVKLKA